MKRAVLVKEIPAEKPLLQFCHTLSFRTNSRTPMGHLFNAQSGSKNVWNQAPGRLALIFFPGFAETIGQKLLLLGEA
jgi:hypothetical protein